MTSAPPHTARTVLALAVALQLVAETALTPYWPRMFRDLFGEERLGATGGFLTACRVAGLVALPLWGLAARRWPLPRLLVAGLLLTGACDLGLALAPTLGLFTLLSAGAVAAGSSLVLAYPALVGVLEGRGRSDRLSAVVVYVAVFHASAVLATAVGAGVVAMPEPRIGLGLFAGLDLALAILVWRTVPVTGRAGQRPRPVRRPGPGRRSLPLRPLLLALLLAVLVDLGFAVTRPFFTELVLHRQGSLTVAGLLFLLPSCAALAVLPATRPLVRRLGPRLLPAAGLVATAGLVVQATTTGVGAMAAGRVLLGVGLGLGMVALDLRVFAAVGTAGPGFAVVETARSGALLAAPLLATATATRGLELPLVAGAALFGLAVVAATARAHRDPVLPPPDPTFPSTRDHDQEALREPDPVR